MISQYLERIYFYFRAPGRVAFIINVVMRVAIVLMVGLLILVIRKSKTTPKNEYRIITMKEGLNSWEIVHNSELTFKHGTKQIEPDALYKIRPRFIDRVRWALGNIAGGFIIVFKDGEDTAIKFEKPKRSAETILIIEQSRALGRALADEFKQAIGGRTIFIVILVIVVGVLVYYFYTGRIG
jgi:hypothetical protein